MLLKRIIYCLLFVGCIWLALATRNHKDWFAPIIVTYGGDVIWAGMFLFFLRFIFVHTPLWKLAVVNYILGVLDELSQLYQAPWFENIRNTRLGRLMLGYGFLWSDIFCYALGTLMAWCIAIWVDKLTAAKALQ